MIIIACLSILYVWYATSNHNNILATKILSLETEDNPIISKWYEMHITHILDFNVDENAIASRFIKRIYNVDVAPNLLVIGPNISGSYAELTGRAISTKVTNDHDSVIDLRPYIGSPCEIAIIRDDALRKRLTTIYKNYDLTALNDIMNNNLDILSSEYVNKVLESRWHDIASINDDCVINNSGSYLYLRECPVSNVLAAQTKYGYRINLLCTDSDWEQFMSRWRKTKF
jgi:hypothetical protein